MSAEASPQTAVGSLPFYLYSLLLREQGPLRDRNRIEEREKWKS